MPQPIPIDTALLFFGVLAAVPGVLGYYLIRERRKVANAASEKLLLLAEKLQAEQATAESEARFERHESLLAAVFECASPGLEFYGQLACTLAGAFEMRHVILALLEPDPAPELRTLAAWSDGKRAENYRYPVAGTPCAEVVAGGTFFCPRDAAALYPADLRLARLGIESYLGKPLLSPTGKVVGIVALLHDQPLARSSELETVLEVVAGRAAARLESERLLLEAQAARAEAEAASRAKDVFLATVSHELRNPLNTIVSWAHLLRVGNLDAAEVALGLDTIERGARTQAQLIEELLDLSRVVSGTMRLERRWIRPLEIIESAIAAIAPAAMAKRITVERHLGPVRPLEADPVRLQQAVFNLLANAVKFTPEGGRVAVRSRQSAGEISIEVGDSGAGIEPELLPWVFDRFRQGAPTASERRKGLGLGLTVVRHIAELHGGTVTAASDGKDRGSTFTLRLPTERRPDLDGTGAFAAEPALVGALAGLRVLVVEDDPEALDALSQLLRSYGAEVEGAGSASQAFATFTAFRPAVLVSDIELPGPSGDELLVQLRSLPPGAGGQIPAVALTASAGEENRRRILSAGFHTRLTKPVEPHALVNLLADLGRASASV